MYVEVSLHGIRDRMLALRSLPNFAGMSDESALRLIEASRERRFRAGRLLFSEDAPLDSIYFVIAGKVTVTREGKPFQVAVDTGAIGVVAALANARTGWRGVADADTVALELPAAAFRANLEEDFSLLRNSLRIMSNMALRARGNLPIQPNLPAELGAYPDRDLTLVERVILLRSSPGPFGNANMEAIIDICRSMEIVRVEPGHMFFEIDDPSAFSLRVNYGRIRCMSPTGEHADVGAGMVLGVLDAWGSQPRSYSARAETQVVAYRSNNEDVLSVLEMHPAVAFKMLVDLATSLLPR
ncbi:MAG: cyclic nucleotide-binding domain-containing protein [Kofleriaceae bacterium]